METEPGSDGGAIAERSPRVRQKIMMAMFKLSSEGSAKAGGRDRRPKWRELLLSDTLNQNHLPLPIYRGPRDTISPWLGFPFNAYTDMVPLSSLKLA